jgi:hypothetical protein
MAAAGAMLTAIFSHAVDRSGLSERQFEFKSYAIIADLKATGIFQPFREGVLPKKR